MGQRRRLFAPVGGRSARIDGAGGSSSDKRTELVENMLHQVNYYGYDLVCSTMPMEIIGDLVKQDLCDHDIRGNSDIIPYYGCISETKKETDRPVGGACFSALTVACQIYGTEALCRMFVKKRRELHEVLTGINRIIFEFAAICVDAGADFFWIADPIGSIVSEKYFLEFSVDYMRKIFGKLVIPGFLHIPGKTNHIINVSVQTGAQCLSIDSYCDIRLLLHRIPENVCLLGNMNSLDMRWGNREDIGNKTIELNEKIVNFPNVIIGSGGGVLCGTPKDNILEMKRITERYPLLWTKEEFGMIRDILTDLNDHRIDRNSIGNEYPCNKEIIDAALNEFEYEKASGTR